MTGAPEIMLAMKTWEAAEWAALTPHPLTAFQYFPSASDVKNGLLYPFSAHEAISTTAARQSINADGSIEDEQTHLIMVYIMFARSGDGLSALSQRDAEWRSRYLIGARKHMTHGINLTLPPGGGRITESVMGQIDKAGFDLLNTPDVGIMIPVSVTVRQSMQFGL